MDNYWNLLREFWRRRIKPASGAEAVPSPPTAPPGAVPSPLILAYLGDAVYELYVRTALAARQTPKVTYLHNAAVKIVQAQAQAEALRAIEPLLTEDEKDIVRRARNAKTARVPKNADVQTYHYSTAFEALLGYLYFRGQLDRLLTLLAQVGRNL